MGTDWHIFLNDVTHIAAALGLAGSIATVFAYHRLPYFNIPTAKVLYFLSFGDFVEAFCKFFGSIAVAAGSTSVLCQIDAVLITFSNLYSIIWMFFIAFVLFLGHVEGMDCTEGGGIALAIFSL